MNQRPLYSTVVARGLPSQTSSTCASAGFPSTRTSRSITLAGIPEAPLATPERPSTPPVDVAATSSLYWPLSIPPPVYENGWAGPLRGAALSCDTYCEIRHDGPLRLTDEMTYYRVLQHFHQWRKAADACPWPLVCNPRPEEVVRPIDEASSEFAKGV
ncbi:hypothetical protein TRIATDRAFT_276331 [Trichoderma atroviride IMI 206040]|uniref:Uncharacterized protein n=1 Tax=Hypocrea atroviridis (strain ATCC 20476 / IMI 206040) TaxID=452589 RepID=G9P3D6_HYPAI|nr:uncharacterized protein TRIATDRAFT_276331 [Trichoderma atroviride IMI 206040]EHK42896.1 hypothetical protein TRIATDRAFT_276331 [Trichoderma atroviride IMI 206040]